MSRKNTSEPKSKGKVPPSVLVALIGLVGTLIAALLASPVVINLMDKGNPTATVTQGPSVEIDGPTIAVFEKKTWFKIKSNNAIRAEWSVNSFADEQLFIVDPLPPTHDIFIEPTNEERIGDMFIITVTVYDKNGASATATKQFTIIEK